MSITNDLLDGHQIDWTYLDTQINAAQPNSRSLIPWIRFDVDPLVTIASATTFSEITTHERPRCSQSPVTEWLKFFYWKQDLTASPVYDLVRLRS